MEDKPKLLYVDDEPENLTVFASAFSRDFQVTTSATPQNAIDLLATEHFDIIVSDQRMPGMTGVEFFQKIRDEFEGTRVLLTGYADMQAIVDAINKGSIYYYCTKPWSRDEFRMVLNKAFEFFQTTRRSELLSLLAENVDQLASLNRTSLEIISRLPSRGPNTKS
jgi:two-component system sensor histidine kinase/response regulator